MSTPLTDRQQAVLDFVSAQIEADGMPPTLAEIAAAFGYASLYSVTKLLAALKEKGFIETTTYKHHGIRVVGMERKSDSFRLPVVGRVAAGVPIQWNDEEHEVVLDRSLFHPRPKYLLRVHGMSMRDDGILDGDLVGVHPTPEAQHGQIVVARIGGDGITVKRLHRTKRTLRLMPSNTDFAPIDIDPTEEFAIEGLYCGLVRPVRA
ncbi:MAG TPA: transcriptional repressor LexA [Rudaea sp.]|jgi:repressor LexA